MTQLLAVAEQLTAAGLSVIPIDTLAEKRPASTMLPLDKDGKPVWLPYQQQIATHEDLAKWFGPAHGLAVVAGAVSGNLTIIDFDVRDGVCLFDDFAVQVEAFAPGLMARLPVISTQSGGRHLYLRCVDCEGSADLAHAPNGRSWIETKGHGGYCLAPVSRGYKAVRGTLREIPEITPEERALLLAVGRSFDTKPPIPRQEKESLPGAAYSAHATLDDMEALLREWGWKATQTRHDGTRLLVRPGKDHGPGATLGQGGRKSLYVFTSSAFPFQANTGYSPFAVYALLKHAGDYRAAAAALAKEGFGGTAERAANSAVKHNVPAPSDYSKPNIMSLRELLARTFQEPKQCIPGIIQEGATLLAGRPKCGKSWTLLHFSLAVANAGMALGQLQTIGGDVLHLALEDGPRLLQRRFRKLLRGGRVPEQLHVATEWPAIDQGGLALIEEWLTAHPNARMVVIDTLAAIRGRDDVKQSAYRQDYAAVSPLTELAHRFNVAIVIATHTRKMEASDVMDTVSGTTGLTGAVDAVIVLTRPRFGPEATLSITGRDIEEHEMGLQWDKDLCQWNYAGSAEEMRLSQTQKQILEALGATEEALTPRDVSERTGLDYNVVRQRMWQMSQSGAIAVASRGKYYLRNTHSNRNNTPETDPIGRNNGRNNGHAPMRDDDPPDDGWFPEFVPDVTALVTPETASHQSSVTVGTNVTAVRPVTPCDGCGRRMWTAPRYETAVVWICSNCGVEWPPVATYGPAAQGG